MSCLKELKELFKTQIEATEVAGIVFEAIQGDSGLIVPPQKYVDELYKICQENGILFIVDEVQQGFGRTGKWFGIQHFGIVPDLMVLGKSIASGMPLSAIVGRAEVLDSLGSGGHIFTNSANLICCSAANATIDVIEEEGLMAKATELGDYAKTRLHALQNKYDFIGEVRGIGLSIGIDLVKDQQTKEKNKDAAAKICYRCWEKGVLLVFFAESVLRFQPPLVITKDQLDQVIDVLDEAMGEFSKGAIPDEVIGMVKGW